MSLGSFSASPSLLLCDLDDVLDLLCFPAEAEAEAEAEADFPGVSRDRRAGLILPSLTGGLLTESLGRASDASINSRNSVNTDMAIDSRIVTSFPCRRVRL